MKEWELKYLLKLLTEQVGVTLGNQKRKGAKNEFGPMTFSDILTDACQNFFKNLAQNILRKSQNDVWTATKR